MPYLWETAVDVGAWLRGLGLSRYQQAFRDHDIDAGLLPTLTADDLRELGVASLGHRKRILAAIATLAEPVDPQPSPAPPMAPDLPTGSQAERRQLTVVFADLAGSTALSSHLDPEEMREILRAYQNTVAGEIARFEGHIAKFMGDGVLAYFGWPKAHEDEAERAVRAGLAIVEAVGRLATPAGEPLAVRVGIATGLVVVGDLVGEGAAQEEAVVGETPNLAARLQGVATPGAVVIADGTRQLLGEVFELRGLGPTRLKGFVRPVRGFRVLGERPTGSRFEARRSGRLLPMIGRDQELAFLLERWRRAAAGEGQAVLLVGEAGIGKSRLVRAMLDAVAGGEHTALRYQCSPYHTGTALHPVIEQLTRAADLAREDPPAARLAKLEVLLAHGTTALAATVPLIAALLGLPTGKHHPLPDLTPQQQKERTLRALVEQLVGLAAKGPVVVVLEDAHWSDPTTQELFDLALERVAHLPVLVVITCRPEFVPPWASRAHIAALTLGRLERGAAAALVEQIAGDRVLPAAVHEQILTKTEGVPLFVEELTKTVLESGLFGDAGGRNEGSTGPLPLLAIPATLQDSLLARLDRLAPVKAVAQIAAVIGREFAYSLLAQVASLPEADLVQALDRLTRAELVLAHGTPPEATYSFKHALVQDTAYQSLLKSCRQQLHARIAQVLEERFSDVAETQPELLARHYRAAGQTEKAIAYWYKAGRRAMMQSAMLEAAAQLTQALELLEGLSPGSDRDRQEVDLQVTLGEALIATEGWAAPQVGRAYGRARELCAEEARLPQLLAALAGLCTHHLHCSGTKVALEFAEELLHLAERRQQRWARAAGHRFLALSMIFNGELLPEALWHFERALALYRPADLTSAVYPARVDSRVLCPAFTALILQWQGYPERALARSREALATAYELGHAYTTSQALFLNCWFHRIRGDVAIVRERAAALVELATEHGFPTWLASGMVFRGWALAARGEIAAGIAEMRQGLARYRAVGSLLVQPHSLGLLAGVITRAGNSTEALVLLAEALAIVDRMEERWFEAELHRLMGEALLQIAIPNAAAAEACFRKAIAVAQAQGTRWWELRAATSLARLWATQGERRKGHDLLAPIYGWFTEGFDMPDLQEARALLDEVALAPQVAGAVVCRRSGE
ncbi:AAA family ATPase [Benzoatithermus flavus]|uniref:AAA family ATPase n=1 Tax=Benzoatithermus flavus TaxID=3108223 RepID=A0ABU8XSI1_9PROT